MDKYEREKMLDNKKAFIAALSLAIREFDGNRTNVKDIRLEVEPSLVPGEYNESIRIVYNGGGGTIIPANCNSNIANMIAIGKALI